MLEDKLLEAFKIGTRICGFVDSMKDLPDIKNAKHLNYEETLLPENDKILRQGDVYYVLSEGMSGFCLIYLEIHNIFYWNVLYSNKIFPDEDKKDYLNAIIDYKPYKIDGDLCNKCGCIYVEKNPTLDNCFCN